MRVSSEAASFLLALACWACQPALSLEATSETYLPSAIKKIGQQADAASAQALRQGGQERPARSSSRFRYPSLSRGSRSGRSLFFSPSPGEVEAQRRAASIQDSAKNLQLLLAQPVSDSQGIFLHPLGTNLYVRNYQITNREPAVFDEPPPVELRATAKKMKAAAQSERHAGR